MSARERKEKNEENPKGHNSSAAAAPEETAPAAAGSPVSFENGETASSAGQLEKLQAEKQELMNMLVRRQADFENYRKRVEKERHEDRHRGAESLIEKLLPMLDAMDRALGAEAGAAAGEEYRKGFELIRRQLWDALAKQGLSRIEAAGKHFNPHFHHAIQSVEGTEYAGGTVIEELQPGYVFQNRVLRPAMVRVAAETEQKSASASKRDN